MATDETVAMANLFSVTDADNNTIKKYRFWDAGPHVWSGNMLIDGLPIPANQWYEIDAADLNRMQWMSASQSFNEEIRIQAYDGKNWSNIESIRVATNEKPVIGVAEEYSVRQQLEFVDVSDLLIKLDDGPAYTRYEVYDSTTDVLSGGFRIGQQVLAAGQVHNLSPQDFFALDFKSGVYEQRSLDEIYMRSYNGTFWSDLDQAHDSHGTRVHRFTGRRFLVELPVATGWRTKSDLQLYASVSGSRYNGGSARNRVRPTLV